MDALTLILAILLALCLGFAAGWFLARSKQTPSQDILQEKSQLQADYAAAHQAKELLTQRVEDLEQRAQYDADILQALAPLRNQLNTMEQSVRSMEQQRSQQYGSVSEALKNSARGQEKLQEITITLTNALRSSSARGTWGEAQLHRVVEAAGMTNHVDYSQQVSTQSIGSDKNKNIRPDMVIHLPGDKSIVLDAKAPLAAYLQAQESKEPGQRERELTKHAKAVRSHIGILSGKEYWSGFKAAPELTLCFIPVESALSAALKADPGLLDYAASKNIALVSPVSLLAALKAISFSWRQDALTDNARELFSLSKQLYQRLSTAGSHLQHMGNTLNKTVESYNTLVGSLETRVLVTARKIADLDSAQLQDSLEAKPLEATTRPLTAPEFTQAADQQENS